MINFRVNNKYYTIPEDNIEAICLFGSYARGENDNLSDLDLFFLINDCDELEFIEKKKTIGEILNIPADWISMYRIPTFKSMCEYGSYFLWHLKSEGEILYSQSGLIEYALSSLPKYSRVERDLEEYNIICNDIEYSIKFDDNSLEYELSLLASIIRNTCISLSYQKNELIFGRISPVVFCKKVIGDSFPFTIDEYKELYNFRIAYSREMKQPIISVPKNDYTKNWLDRARFLIEYALKTLRKGCEVDE